MDLDAILTFKQVLIKDEITRVDIMMLTSAINNYNIDVNLSLKSNLSLISNDVTSEELLVYLKEFIGDNREYLDIPVYKLLLQKEELRFLLINAHKKNMLSVESILEIFELLVTYINLNGYNKELIDFFKILLNYRRPVAYELFKNSSCLNDFAFYHLDELVDESNDNLKTILIAFYSQGYLHFSKMYDYNANFDIIFRKLINTMLNKHLFSNIKMIINEHTVDENLLNIVIEELENFEDTNNIKNHKFINDLYGIINKVQEKLEKNKALERH